MYGVGLLGLEPGATSTYEWKVGPPLNKKLFSANGATLDQFVKAHAICSISTAKTTIHGLGPTNGSMPAGNRMVYLRSQPKI